MKNEPKAAVFLEQSGVEGKGRVIFSQLQAGIISMGKGKRQKTCFENMWTYLLGESIKGSGPGKSLGLVDPYKKKVPGLNPLYFSQANDQRWWNKDYEMRLPIVVAEPIGLERRRAPVSIKVKKRIKGFKLLTHYEKEIVTQAVKHDDSTELIFQVDLLPYENQLFFLYLKDNEEIKDGEETLEAEEPSLLFAQHNGDFIDLGNDAIRAKVHVNKPAIASLKLRRGDLGDRVFNFGGKYYGYGSAFNCGGSWKSKRWPAPVILERGPVRTVISQRDMNRGLEVRFILYAGDVPYLAQVIKPLRSKVNLYRASQWAPAARLDRVNVYYEAMDSIRHINLEGAGYVTKVGDMYSFMKEGWYALRDTSGGLLGVCFDKPPVTACSVNLASHHGLQVVMSGQLKGVFNSLAIAEQGGYKKIRDIYLSFKNPPVAAKGTWQDYRPVPMPKIDPKKALYRMYHSPRPDHFFHYMTPEEMAKRVSLFSFSRGADVIRIGRWEPKSEKVMKYWAELVRLCKVYGLSIFGVPPSDPFPQEERKAMEAQSVGNICPVAFRKSYYERWLGGHAKAASIHGGADQLHIMDEYSYHCTCPECKALFRKRYGGDLPPSYGPKCDIKDPNYANSVIFRTEIITELARDVCQVIKGHLPESTIYSVVNIKGLCKVYRHSDLEEHSRHLDMGGVDLYSAHTYYRSSLMFVRGAFGNKKRVENCVGYENADGLRYQMDLSTMYGASMFYFACGTDSAMYPKHVSHIAVPYYCWLKFSGYAELMGDMQPVRYTALLRDRNFVMESIRNGEGERLIYTMGSEPSIEKGLYRLANLKNMQMDMVCSRFFDMEALKGYDLLLVPDNKYLSEAFASTIKAFVEQGGCAYIEGKSCRVNPVMTALCSDGRKLTRLKDCDIYKRDAGKGTLLYTDGFLSKDLHGDKGLQEDLKELLFGIKPNPVKIESETAGSMDYMLFSDGKKFMLNLLNESFCSEAVGSARFNLEVEQPAVWVNMKTGQSGEFDGTIKFNIQPKSTGFFLISPSAAFKMPLSEIERTDPGCYSRSPGMLFMKTEIAEEEETVRKIGIVPGKINVGLFVFPKRMKRSPKRSLSQFGIEKELKKVPDIALHVLEDLDYQLIRKLDVVVVPNVRKAAPPSGWEINLRKYVLSGGNALLTHQAVGIGASSGVMFPEVGQGVGFSKGDKMRPVADHPVVTGKGLNKGASGLKNIDKVFTCGFPDYVAMTPGSSGKVIVKSFLENERAPEDVIVVGKVGKGKVVLCGMSIGSLYEMKDGEWRGFVPQVQQKGEYEILLNSIRWLAQ